MMKDIQVFVEIHRRIQGTPPQMALALQEVWKKLQLFAANNPLSFYELALCFKFPHGYVPNRPWRKSIVEAGFASVVKLSGKSEFTVHDLVEIIFKEYLLTQAPAPAPAGDPSPAPPSAVVSTGPKQVRKKNGKKA